jgi:hypothetical protein
MGMGVGREQNAGVLRLRLEDDCEKQATAKALHICFDHFSVRRGVQGRGILMEDLH